MCYYGIHIGIRRGCPRGSVIKKKKKNPPAMQEVWVQSLGWEDPLKKEMATCSSVFAWETPWTENTGGLQPWGCRVRHDLVTENTHRNKKSI